MHNSTAENINFVKAEEPGQDELSVMAEKYPFYAIAQFRLLSSYKKNKNTDFEKQALVTALFFNNTRWLNRQLYYKTDITDKHKESEEINKISTTPYEETGSSIHKISPEQNEQTIEKNALTESTNDEFDAFEPLHTVDYFASQGIKVSDEPMNNDKLATQLKSFTEWLKSMKKTHAQLPEADEQTDKVIQHMAESSNTNMDIVTEALAEVLVKQDKIEQAVEMYEKLKLNYPAKSAYFAAKINSLKSV